MSRVKILRYGQILALIDADPEISNMICVRAGADIDAVIDEVTHPTTGRFILADLHQQGLIRIVTSLDVPEERFEELAMPRDALGHDVLCKIAREGRILIFQPMKELPLW